MESPAKRLKTIIMRMIENEKRDLQLRVGTLEKEVAELKKIIQPH